VKYGIFVDVSKSWYHRLFKILLWSFIGLWVLALVALQIALRPSILTKTANRIAAGYVDGEVKFTNIKASVLKSFPNLNLTVDGFSIVGENPPDTLASLDRLSLSVNYMEALKGKIRIRHAVLEHPRIFLRQYDSTRANWNIIRIPSADENDTSSFKVPPISIGKVSLENSPYISFNSVPDSIDVAASMDHLTIKGKKDHYGVDLDSKIHLETNGTGKMDLPVKINGALYPDFERNVFAVKDLTASVAMIDFTAEGSVDVSSDSLLIQAEAALENEPVNEVTEYFGDNFPILKKLDTDAKISLEAKCDGYYNPKDGKLPDISIHMTVPDSKVAWEGIDEKGRFDLEATAVVSDGKLSARIPDLMFKIKGADIHLNGSSDDLLSDDPLFKIDSRLHLVLDSLQRFIPENIDLSARGNLDGNLKGGFRLSQMDIYNFDKISLRGDLKSDGIRIRAFGDTLAAYLGRTAISLGRTGSKSDTSNEEESDSEDGHVVLTASVDSLTANYGASTYFRGRGVRLSAHNADETIKGTKGRHPLVGHLDISSIGMMDLDSCFVGVRGSSNTFKLTEIPKENGTIPHLSLGSSNKSVRIRESVNRYSLDGATLNVSAQPASTETIQRKRLPGRDSLRRTRPDYLSEKDFEKKDIHISLGETVSKYIKEWDLSGSLKVKEGKVITPYFPLENKFSGLSGKFTNNKIDLSSLTINSGASDISARGSLSGLRRALTSARGRLTLDLNLSSEVIDLNELLLAINAGGQYVPPGEKAALSEIDDASYMRSVKKEAVQDTAIASPLIVIPSNLTAKVGVQAGTIRYSDLETSFVSTDLEMKERCLQMTNTFAMTNMGEVFLEGFYSTRTKKDLTAGFDLMLSNITAEKVIQLFPAVDSIIPMLKAFKGLLDCEIAATSAIDTSMNIVLPSLSGMVKIDGKNLSLSESEDLDKLRKTLRFKDRDSSYIDRMSVRGIVKENQLEVFPFILNVDRYTLALNGLQGFDQRFKYHVAAIKSPIPFRFGVNLGGTFSDWRWKLGKAKYKSVKIPLFDDEIDGLRVNLVSSIHNIFDRGIEQAIRRNEESQQAIEEKKAEVAYTGAEETEELSESMKKELEAM